MGGKSGSSYRAPVEAPDSLQSMQEVTIIEAVSEGPIVGLATGDAQSIALNETPLMTEEGAYTYQNVSWAIRNGTADQDVFDNITGAESEVTVSVEVTKDFPRASGSGSGAVTRQITNPYCTDVRITMSVNALYEQLTDEDRSGDTVAVTISYDVLITDSDNVVVASDSVERTDKTTSSAQWAKKYSLSGTAPWTVKITKTYADNESDYKYDDIYWSSYTEIIGYKMIYPHTACMMIRGNAETFGNSVPERAYKIKGLIVEVPSNYDPETRAYSGVWDGTFKNAWTDNPAWVLRDIIESGRYGLKKFFPPAQQNNALCDKWTLYEIAQYCDELVSDGNGGQEPRYTFNGQITGSGSASEVLQSIASNFHGMMYWGSGMVIAVADVPKDPIKSITQANVIDGAISYSTGSAQERHSVALVTWYDPDDYGNARIEPVYDWDAYQEYGYRTVNVTAYGCTSRAQAYRQGLWTLLTEDEQWQASCVVGLDGYDLMPGDFVRLADPSWMGTRFSGRILSISGKQVTLDGEVVFASGESYVLYVMMPDGTEEHRDITTGAGTYSVITIASAFSQTPVDYAVWTISGTDVAPRLFAVRSIEEKESGQVELSLREVMTSKYERLEQSFSFTTTPGRRATTGALAAPTGLTVVPATYISGGQVYQRLTFSWTGSGDSLISEYEFGYKSPSGDWKSFTPAKVFSLDVAAAASGAYLFRVRALSLDGRQSAWAEKSYTLEGVTTAPKAPSSVTATGGYRSVTVSWTMPSDALIGYFEVLMANSENVEDAELAGKIYGSSFDVMGLGVLDTKWFWVRSVSYADDGITSEAVGPVSATTNAIEMEDIPEASISESKLASTLSQKIDSITDGLIPSIFNALSLDAETENGVKAERTLNTKITDGLEAAASERLELSARIEETAAAVVEETTARVTADEAAAERITTLAAQQEETAAAVVEETTARVTADEAAAERITTLAVQQGETAAALEIVDQVVLGEGGLTAQHYIKTDVNGNVAGYGLYNSGDVSEFTILADKFFIAKADGTATPIFEVDSGTGLVQLIGDLIASGSITGDKINAAAKIQLGDGGMFIAGAGAIVQIGTSGTSAAMLLDSETGRIVVRDPDNLTTGDYVSIDTGDVTTYKYINGAYRAMKSLMRAESGVASNGTTVTLSGYWPSNPKIIISPSVLQCYDSSYPDQTQELTCYADSITNKNGVVTFVPRAYLGFSAGSKVVGNPVSVTHNVTGSYYYTTTTISVTSESVTVPDGASEVVVTAKVWGQYARQGTRGSGDDAYYIYYYCDTSVTLTAHFGSLSQTMGTTVFSRVYGQMASEPSSSYETMTATFSSGSGEVYITAEFGCDSGSWYQNTNALTAHQWLRFESVTYKLSSATKLAEGTLNYIAIA